MRGRAFGSLFLLATFGLALGCSDDSDVGATDAASDTDADAKSVFPRNTEQLERVLVDLPEYEALWRDSVLRSQLDQYFRLLASPAVEDPGAVYLVGLVDQGVTSYELSAAMFHELAELNNWLRLGYRFEDILDTQYRDDHWQEFYPKGHCNAMVAQEQILKGFASQMTGTDIPMLAFDLVAPDNERWDVIQETTQRSGVPGMVLQLVFNNYMFNSAVSDQQIRAAIRAFELGHYDYRDKTEIESKAKAFAELSPSQRSAALSLAEVLECEPIEP